MGLIVKRAWVFPEKERFYSCVNIQKSVLAVFFEDIRGPKQDFINVKIVIVKQLSLASLCLLILSTWLKRIFSLKKIKLASIYSTIQSFAMVEANFQNCICEKFDIGFNLPWHPPWLKKIQKIMLVKGLILASTYLSSLSPWLKKIFLNFKDHIRNR